MFSLFLVCWTLALTSGQSREPALLPKEILGDLQVRLDDKVTATGKLDVVYMRDDNGNVDINGNSFRLLGKDFVFALDIHNNQELGLLLFRMRHLPMTLRGPVVEMDREKAITIPLTTFKALVEYKAKTIVVEEVRFQFRTGD